MKRILQAIKIVSAVALAPFGLFVFALGFVAFIEGIRGIGLIFMIIGSLFVMLSGRLIEYIVGSYER